VEIDPAPIAAAKLLTACNLVSSGGEAKRMITQSAVTIDGEKVSDPNAEITPANGMTIKVGKRKFAQIKLKS
jgi:tyrosyl-tRNA synthetase